MVEDSISETLIEGNIHWVKLYNSKRQTIEDIFGLFTKNAESTPSGEMLLYLFDSNGIPELPVRYLIQRADKWEKEQAFIPPTRTAILYNTNNMMLFAVNMLIKKFGKYDNETRVFSNEQHEEAIAWLKSVA